MLESNFIDEKTKRHYLLFVDLFMNLAMSGLTIDLSKDGEIIKENIQLSEFFNYDVRTEFFNYTKNCCLTLIINDTGETIGNIDLEFNYGTSLHETSIITSYSDNLIEIINVTDNLTNYLNKFDVYIDYHDD